MKPTAPSITKDAVFFVEKHSIVREIWGKSDTILFIFAGAAAEFAVSKAVDWLYFTGKLPADPLGRLFSTVDYARKIVFSVESEAFAAIDDMNNIHKTIEAKRGTSIPQWAYRDVLFMLIDYSIRSYELLEHKLTTHEKQEVFEVFHRVGIRMEIEDLPNSYKDWLEDRANHLSSNITFSHYSADLFEQYKKHLGWFRFKLLKELQLVLTPHQVRNLLPFKGLSIIKPIIALYKVSRTIRMDDLMKNLVLPKKYRDQIKAMDQPDQK